MVRSDCIIVFEFENLSSLLPTGRTYFVTSMIQYRTRIVKDCVFCVLNIREKQRLFHIMLVMLNAWALQLC